MLSIINLSVTAMDETTRGSVIGALTGSMQSLVVRSKNVHVSLSTRDYADDELIQEEPDWEMKYQELKDAVAALASKWSNSPQQYKQKMAEELLLETELD